MVGKGRAHVGCGAVAVVGKGFAVNGNARRTIAFVNNGFVIGSVLARTKGLVDSSLDLVLGQRITFGLFNGRRKRCVVFRVRVAAFLGRNRNIT